MPYKDPEKQAEYMRKYRTPYMRDYREQKKAKADEFDEKVNKFLAWLDDLLKEKNAFANNFSIAIDEIKLLKMERDLALKLLDKEVTASNRDVVLYPMTNRMLEVLKSFKETKTKEEKQIEQ